AGGAGAGADRHARSARGAGGAGQGRCRHTPDARSAGGAGPAGAVHSGQGCALTGGGTPSRSAWTRSNPWATITPAFSLLGPPGGMAVTPADFHPPAPPLRTLGRYRLMRPLGQGGMGAVYLAHDAKLDRTVAVKLLPPHSTSDARAVARFQREARA